MIKLKTIADLIDNRTDDLTTEFDDSKDIFFKTIYDEYIAILKCIHDKFRIKSCILTGSKLSG